MIPTCQCPGAHVGVPREGALVVFVEGALEAAGGAAGAGPTLVSGLGC